MNNPIVPLHHISILINKPIDHPDTLTFEKEVKEVAVNISKPNLKAIKALEDLGIRKL
jgi:hypothetical protein